FCLPTLVSAYTAWCWRPTSENQPRNSRVIEKDVKLPKVGAGGSKNQAGSAGSRQKQWNRPPRRRVCSEKLRRRRPIICCGKAPVFNSRTDPRAFAPATCTSTPFVGG